MIARLVLTALFLCLWLPLASLAVDNASLLPPLAGAKLYGPLAWEVESRAIVQDNRHLVPAFVVYGKLTAGQTEQVAVRTGLFRWLARLQGPGQNGHRSAAELLFATDQPQRPFVADGDLQADAGLTVHLGRLRVNAQFFLWTLLALVSPLLFYFWLTAEPGRVPSPQELWQRDEDFRRKVKDIEIDYKDRPGALRLHTVLLAFLGYGVLFFSIALLLAAGLGLGLIAYALTQIPALGVLAGLVPAGFAFKLFRSLLSARSGDSGVQLKPAEAPALFALLEKIREKTQGPAWKRVFITGDMNASVSRSSGPMGFFGFGPVKLELGLPLLQALSPQQIEGVLGHEYGHVAARDNAFAQWVYRIRYSWLDLGGKLKADPLWHVLRLNLFYDWFLGSFKAYSFSLSRLCEYEADAFAGRVAGKKQITEALVALHVYSRRLQRGFWRGVWKNAETAPEPHEAPYTALAEYFREPVSAEAAIEELNAIRAEKTGFTSTHPATISRVEALDGEITAPRPAEKSAARALLGNMASELCGAFDRNWRLTSFGIWRLRHAEYQRALKRREDFGGRTAARLTQKELEALADAGRFLEDDKTVLAAYEELSARDPADVVARIHMLGYRLSVKSDESALLKLEETLRENPGYLALIARHVLRHLQRHNRLEEAEVWQFRLDEWEYQSREADDVFVTDPLTRHQLKADEIRQLKDYFGGHPAVSRVYIATKPLVHLKGYAMVEIGIRRSPWTLHPARLDRELRNLISKSPWYRRYHLFLLSEKPGMERKMKAIPDSRIL